MPGAARRNAPVGMPSIGGAALACPVITIEALAHFLAGFEERHRLAVNRHMRRRCADCGPRAPGGS